MANVSVPFMRYWYYSSFFFWIIEVLFQHPKKAEKFLLQSLQAGTVAGLVGSYPAYYCTSKAPNYSLNFSHTLFYLFRKD